MNVNQTPIAITVAAIGDDTVQTVNARELHAGLEIAKNFSDWIKIQIERARLVENRDYVVVAGLHPQKGVQTGSGGHNRIDYHLTIDAAKHVAMMSGGDKGFEIRDYFIECERRLRGTSQLSEIEVARRYLASLEEAQRLKEKIAANLLFPRGTNTGGEPISIKAIKAQFAPYLAEPKIRLVLRWYGQGRTRFQFGSHENASFQTFQREGLEEVFEHFSRDRTMRVSATGTSVIIDHECLDGETCRVPRDAAIAHLGFTEHDFPIASGNTEAIAGRGE